MERRRWSLRGLGMAAVPLVALGISACAGPQSTVIEPSRISQLPPDAQQKIAEQQEEETQAELNQSAAQTALDTARKFRDATNGQLSAAIGRRASAERGLSLGQRTYDQNLIRSAQQNLDTAQREIAALQAKRDFADRLVDLRQARVDETDAELDLARSNVDRVQLTELERYNLAQGLDRRAIFGHNLAAQDRVARARERVAQIGTQVADARGRWMAQRQAATAARGQFMPPPPTTPPELVAPPSGTAPLPPPATNAPPPGSPNEGPAAPESVPLPQPNQLP